MKNSPVLIFCLLLSILSNCFFSLSAQHRKAVIRQDTLVMLTGEKKQGQIKSIDGNEIRFVHSGESLVYTLKKTDIEQIQFASGRKELLNFTAAQKNKNADAQVTPHLVAILPFKFSALNEPPGTAGSVEEKVQQEAYLFLSKNAGIYKYQEPRTTNAILFKQGINAANIQGYTFEEICRLLGTEYTIQGTLSRTTKEKVVTDEQKTFRKRDDRNIQDKSVSTKVKKDYQNELTIGIYNNRNEKVYMENRKSMLDDEDSYKNTLMYLLKRCPVYNK